MSETALECLEKLGTHRIEYREGFELGFTKTVPFKSTMEYKIIKQALQRLEAIDNANPSEALGLVKRTCEIYVDILKQRDLIGYDIIEKQINEALDAIKQALLKQQELPEPFKTGVDMGVIKPKQYLNWEDLEFTKDLKCQKVKMNDNDYRIRYTLDDFGGKCCFLYDSARNHYIVLNKQFFNDLHLERVEE